MGTIRVKVKDRKNTKFIAHRGLSGLEIENTLAAFVAAGNRDYFGVETDIHVTSDGKFAVYHDDSTGRLCDADIPLEGSSLAALRALRFSGERAFGQCIPTLEEYLLALRPYGKTAVIELKNPMRGEKISEIAARCTSLYPADKIIFISFFMENLENLRRILPRQRVQFLTGEYSSGLVSRLAEAGMELDIAYPELTAARVEELHRRGVCVNCWTCDDPAAAQDLIDWGVDMLTTNILQ